MKIELIKAYKSNDGCIWETEAEAIAQNIDECMGKAEIGNADNYTVVTNKLQNWFRDHKKDVRYVLNNIDKI